MNKKTVTKALERIDSVVDVVEEASRSSTYVKKVAPVFIAGVVTGGLAVGLPMAAANYDPEPVIEHSTEQSYVLAEVVSEHYRPSEVTGGDSTYTLHLRTKEGSELSLTVLDRGSVTKENLETIIEPGTRFMFPSGIHEYDSEGNMNILPRETVYSPGDATAAKYADRLQFAKER